VLLTVLISIAERVGANRIVRAEGRFHHPLGDPTLSPDAEAAWRLDHVRAALKFLTEPVSGPTVKHVRELLA